MKYFFIVLFAFIYLFIMEYNRGNYIPLYAYIILYFLICRKIFRVDNIKCCFILENFLLLMICHYLKITNDFVLLLFLSNFAIIFIMINKLISYYFNLLIIIISVYILLGLLL